MHNTVPLEINFCERVELQLKRDNFQMNGRSLTGRSSEFQVLRIFRLEYIKNEIL